MEKKCMTDKEKDSIEHLLRAKLYDYEAETTPGDWEMIANRLPAGQVVPFYRKVMFRAAAAVFLLLLAFSGVYLFEKETVTPAIVEEISRKTEEVRSRMVEESGQPDTQQPESLEPVRSVTQKIRARAIQPARKQDTEMELPARREISDDEEISEAANDEWPNDDDAALESPMTMYDETAPVLMADAVSATNEKNGKQTRRWGFGMGAGGLSVGSSNVVPDYVVNSGGLRQETLMVMNAAAGDPELPKTDVNHRMPISFGLGVSYILNDRFSLQTGLNYSYLSSDWITNGKYHIKTKQKLHFLGIPLSITYKIAEWNQFNFYASAGVQAEINFTGHQKMQLLVEDKADDVELDSEKLSVRMKEPLFSVNTRVGVSYPLLSFLSAYGEVGAGYYFDNGSKIETIHSEKPFNVNAQLGFRLNF